MIDAPLVVRRVPFGGNVEFRVEAALAKGLVGGQWNVDVWNTGVWASTQPQWTTSLSGLLGVTVSRGRDRWGDRHTPGTATLTFDNSDGMYSPLGGLPLPEHIDRLRPGIWIRVQGRVEGVEPAGWETMFAGRIDRFTDSYTQAGWDATAVLECVGFTAELARMKPADPTVLPIQRAHVRLNTILDQTEWPTNVGSHPNHLQAAALLEDLMTEAWRAAESVGATIIETRGATVAVKPRSWLYGEPRSTEVQFIAGASSTEVAVLGVNAAWDLSAIVNLARYGRRDLGAGELIAEAEDTASQSLYGIATLESLDLDTLDLPVLEELADLAVNANAYDRMRIIDITVHPLSDEGAYKLITTELGDLVLIEVDVQGDEWMWWTPTHVMRVTHQITADDWTVNLRVDDSGLAGAPLPIFPTPEWCAPWLIDWRPLPAGESPALGVTHPQGVPDTSWVFSVTDADGTDRATQLLASVGQYMTIWDAAGGPTFGWAEYLITDAVPQDTGAPPPPVNPWVNFAQGGAVSNGTTSHTVPFGFTSTAGNLLVFVAACPWVNTMAGWTSRINVAPGTGSNLDIYTKTSTGESSATVTHGPVSNMQMEWAVYEFPAGSTYTASVGGPYNTTGVFNTLSGLPASTPEQLVIAVICRRVVSTAAPATISAGSWTGTTTEDKDHFMYSTTADGFFMATAHQTGVLSSVTPGVTITLASGMAVADMMKASIAFYVPPVAAPGPPPEYVTLETTWMRSDPGNLGSGSTVTACFSDTASIRPAVWNEGIWNESVWN